MIIFAVLFLIYAVIKKTYRYFPVCVAVALYTVVYQLRGDPAMTSSPLFAFLSAFEWITLAAVVAVVIWTCVKRENGEQIYSLPIILTASALAVRIVRSISYDVLIERAMRPGADVMHTIRILDRIYAIANVAFEIMLCLVLFSMFWKVYRQQEKSA